jgi:outer membrane protein
MTRKSGLFGGRVRAIALAGLVAVAPGLAAAETLADALALAYRNSNLLDQNEAVLRAADEDVAGAIAALRPVVSYVIQAGLSQQAFSSGAAGSIGISAQVPLFDFGRGQIATDIAREAVLATREALVGVEQNVLLQAVIAYMNVRSAEENVAINRNSVRVIGEALRAAEDRFELGEITRTEVAQAEARLAAARAGLAAEEGGLAIAREAYRAATGGYPSVLAPPPRAPALPRTLEEAKAIAQRSHPAIRQAQRQVTIAELGVSAAAAQRAPNVTAGFDVTSATSGEPSGRIGVTMSQTLYTGGALSSAHRKAIAGRDAAKSGLLQTSVSVSSDVGSAWARIAVTQAQIAAIDRQIRAATEAYRGISEEASLGARTTLDVLDAEQDLLDAQADRISAEASLQIAIYGLLASMGLLTVEHLELGVPVYDPQAYYNAVKDAPVTSVQGESLDRVLKAIGKN